MKKATPPKDATDISHMLADRIEDLCWVLFPSGRIEGNWFLAEGWQGDPLKTVHVDLRTGGWRVTERRWVSPEPEAVQ